MSSRSSDALRAAVRASASATPSTRRSWALRVRSAGIAFASARSSRTSSATAWNVARVVGGDPARLDVVEDPPHGVGQHLDRLLVLAPPRRAGALGRAGALLRRKTGCGPCRDGVFSVALPLPMGRPE